jgi:hypothetical protein
MKKIKYVCSLKVFEKFKLLCCNVLRPKYTGNVWFTIKEVSIDDENIYVEMDFPYSFLKDSPILQELEKYEIY